MLLLQLELSNFRSFYGVTTVEFAGDPQKAVTVFHGENGAGKTNLLNAIYWCVTGEFTPRFQDTHLLINKAAAAEGTRETYVELRFLEGDLEYRARRTLARGNSVFDLWQVRGGNSQSVNGGERAMARFIAPSLVRWFFFDAEAIGALELSGSEQFRQDLRKTLGFELVDKLVRDLEAARNRRQREVSVQVNDKALKEIQDAIDNIEAVLPDQRAALLQFEQSIASTKERLVAVQKELSNLPKSSKLQERRAIIEKQREVLEGQKRVLERRAAQLCGESAPAIFLKEMASDFEKTLEIEEIQGKLPRPYSDQLVKEILDSRKCICGREVPSGSVEEVKIKELLTFASTGVLNQRVKEVQLVLRDIDRISGDFVQALGETRASIATCDQDVGDIESELEQISIALGAIDEDHISKLETEREGLIAKLQELSGQHAVIRNQIARNEAQIKDYQLRYEKSVGKAKVGAKLQKELGKIARLMKFVEARLTEHESRALRILTFELNQILEKYLAKHFHARIDSSTYAVNLLDVEGKSVGHSTGEGQVLKFAFISSVVALAAKKTVEKIDFLAEPTQAPLVLDAPLSALDPEYQGSVARNLAAQTNQLVLMLSSAGWSDSVSNALKPHIGREYVLISKLSGPRNNKPIKKMKIWGRTYDLNEYSSQRDESSVEKVQ